MKIVSKCLEHGVTFLILGSIGLLIIFPIVFEFRILYRYETVYPFNNHQFGYVPKVSVLTYGKEWKNGEYVLKWSEKGNITDTAVLYFHVPTIEISESLQLKYTNTTFTVKNNGHTDARGRPFKEIIRPGDVFKFDVNVFDGKAVPFLLHKSTDAQFIVVSQE